MPDTSLVLRAGLAGMLAMAELGVLMVRLAEFERRRYA
jgi:hypothetical protein